MPPTQVIDLKNTTAYVELLKAYKDLCKKVNSLSANDSEFLAFKAGFEGNVTNMIMASSSYVHTQIVSSSLWVVNHGLGYKPAGIMVFDSANEEWWGTITHLNDDSLTINFNGASFGGKAYLS